MRRSAPEGQNAVQKQAPPESKEPVNNPHVPFFAFLLAAAGTAAAGIAYALNSAGEGAPGMLTGFLEYWPLFPWGVFGVRVIRRLANRHVIKEGVVELGFLIALLFWTGLAVAFDINTGGLLRLTVSLAENWFYAVGAVAALAALFVFYEQARYIGWPFRKNKISWFSISPRGIFGALAGAMSALPLFGIAPFASLILPLVGFVVAANYRLPDSETVGNGSTLGFLVGIAAMTHMALLGWPFVAIAFIPALAVALGWFIEAYWW